MNIQNNNDQSIAQAELPLNTSNPTRPGDRPSGTDRPMARGVATGTHHRQRTRIERAAWWFRRMHQAVDQAATPNRNLQPAQA